MGCKHEWVIDPANEPTSKGVCRLCGEERQFSNVLVNCVTPAAKEEGEYGSELNRILAKQFSQGAVW